MIVEALTDTDKGREVKYVSTSGHTVQLGRLDSWDETYVFVSYHTKLRPEGPKAQRAMKGEPVKTDPANLEFA